MWTALRRPLSILVAALLGWILIMPLVGSGVILLSIGRTAPPHGAMYWVVTYAIEVVSGLASGMVIAVLTWLTGRRPWDGAVASALAAGTHFVSVLLYVAGIHPTWLAGTHLLGRMPLVWWLLQVSAFASAILGSLIVGWVVVRRQARNRTSPTDNSEEDR